MMQLHRLVRISSIAFMSLSTRKASSLVPGAATTAIACCCAIVRGSFSRPGSSSLAKTTRRYLGWASLSTSSSPRPPPQSRKQLHRLYPFGELAAHTSSGSPTVHTTSLSTSRPSTRGGRIREVAQGPSRGVPRSLLRASAVDSDGAETFKPGDNIQVEILSFGPLGASVGIVSRSHDPDDVLPESDPFWGRGLILQKEISYHRESRDGIDVVRGEILPAYVERVRDTGNVDVALRKYGGKAKADDVAVMIMDRLAWTRGGVLPVGDKSSPKEIQGEFPGVSKASFKRAVAALYKQGKVQPNSFSIQLMKLASDKPEESPDESEQLDSSLK